MSIKFTAPARLGLLLLKSAIAGWALIALVGHAYYWIKLATGSGQSGRLQVRYWEVHDAVPDSILDFALTSVVFALLTATLWYALQMVRRLEVAELDYSDVIRQLARFATALCLYSVSSAIATVVIVSVDLYQQTGEPGIALVLELDQVNLLIISLVLFLVGKALRVADEAVQETQNFL